MLIAGAIIIVVVGYILFIISEEPEMNTILINYEVYEKIGVEIDGYDLYYIRISDESYKMCEPTTSTVIFYEYEDEIYTTGDLWYQDSCYSPYYIYDEGEHYSLNQALHNGMISIESLRETEFEINLERVYRYDVEVENVQVYKTFGLEYNLTETEIESVASDFSEYLYRETYSGDFGNFLFYLEITEPNGNKTKFKVYENVTENTKTGYICATFFYYYNHNIIKLEDKIYP